MMIWLRKNLFRSVGDSLVTVIAGSLSLYVLFRIVRFVAVTGRWQVVETNLALLVNGAWPTDEIGRLSATIVLLGFLGGVASAVAGLVTSDVDSEPPTLFQKALDLAIRLWPLALIVGLVLLLSTTTGPLLLTVGVVGAVTVGRLLGGLLPGRVRPVVIVVALFGALASIWFMSFGHSWDDWGGILVNFFLAAISISLCFPIGVILALGRRSEFPILRMLSTVFIELFRGVPLIALLLMAKNTLGFFVPQEFTPGAAVRAIVVFVLFTSAYVAEIVRGGLQSVPKGQIEAARANGLTPIPTTFRIVLPQALRNVIPALVGQFISLFKDTTLAGVALGFLDLLEGGQAITQQAEFRGQGLVIETLAFVGLLFWAGSYTMSRESQRLESKLGVGSR